MGVASRFDQDLLPTAPCSPVRVEVDLGDILADGTAGPILKTVTQTRCGCTQALQLDYGHKR